MPLPRNAPSANACESPCKYEQQVIEAEEELGEAQMRLTELVATLAEVREVVGAGEFDVPDHELADYIAQLLIRADERFVGGAWDIEGGGLC